ncbi:MAG: hypothetical protein WAW17_14120 [Rhodococcus sp. (in: high G+C Gram-positive bacteria)]
MVSICKLRQLPPRLTTGAFILNSGLSKWSGDEEVAAGLHGMASGTYPVLEKVDSAQFLRMVAVAEIGLGAALLIPVVPSLVAGAGLAGFSAGLLGLYLRIPGMRIGLRPTHEGTPVAKDIWMLGIGLGLVIDELTTRGS